MNPNLLPYLGVIAVLMVMTAVLVVAQVNARIELVRIQLDNVTRELGDTAELIKVVRTENAQLYGDVRLLHSRIERLEARR